MEPEIRRNAIHALSALAPYAPSASHMLGWVGLEPRRSPLTRFAVGLGWFSLGAALGGGLTLLLTPQSGRELRHMLRPEARRAARYVQSAAGRAADVVRHDQPVS
jgi:hypothetical protein